MTAVPAPDAGEEIPPSPEHPVYRKVRESEPGEPGNMFLISCDEGWRSSIVCAAMYEWAADWLLAVLGRRPYAPDTRPAGAR